MIEMIVRTALVFLWLALGSWFISKKSYGWAVWYLGLFLSTFVLLVLTYRPQ